MSRRRPKGELQFGSDSFLDVVANIVGILIILIVIAGLRVSQTPVVLIPSEKSDSAETIAAPVASSIPDLPEETEPVKEPVKPQVIVLQPVEEPPVEEEPEPPKPPLPELVVPRDIVELTQQRLSEIAALKEEEARFANQSKQSAQRNQTLLERQRAIQNMLSEQSQELDANRKQAAKAEADMELLKQTLERLKRQLSEIESKPKNVEALEHKVTPISRVVHGTEKHYRLEKNRVVEVPIEDLVHRFQEQMVKRRDWFVKTRHANGEIGPLRGFTMHYAIRLDTLSDFDAARFSSNGPMLLHSRYEFKSEPDLKGETAEVALRKGSQFYQSIISTAPDTTLTFWVYPDSYSLFQKLKKFGHDHGYSVAGRPLPFGVPIAAGTDGSRSASE